MVCLVAMATSRSLSSKSGYKKSLHKGLLQLQSNMHHTSQHRFQQYFKLYHSSQCTCPWFPGVLLTSTPHNILSKPLAAFPHNRCRNKWKWWERNKSCRNDYHHASEKILAKPGTELVTSCSQVHNTTDWAMGLGLW